MPDRNKKYLQPNSLTEAVNCAYDNIEDFRYIAGGTDVLVNKYQGNEVSSCFIDLSRIDELDGISVEGSYLRIGALSKLCDLGKNSVIKQLFPSLIEAALSVGSPLIRASATIGGNILCENRCIFYNQSNWWRDSIGFCLKCDGDICIATGSKIHCYSEMISDTAPALISMHAKIELQDMDGTFTEDLKEIYSGEGVNPRKIRKTSIVKAILLPMDRGFEVVFRKLRLRQSLDFTSLTSAVSLDNDGHVCVSLSGVDPAPVVVDGTIDTPADSLIKDALKKARSIDNEMMTRTYRREMLKRFITSSLNNLKQKVT